MLTKNESRRGIQWLTCTAIVAGVAAFGMVGCDTEGPAEEAGENIDEAGENIGEAGEDVGDELE